MQEEHFLKIQNPSMIEKKKKLLKLRTKENFLHLIKNIYKNLTANIILVSEKIEAFP